MAFDLGVALLVEVVDVLAGGFLARLLLFERDGFAAGDVRVALLAPFAGGEELVGLMLRSGVLKGRGKVS